MKFRRSSAFAFSCIAMLTGMNGGAQGAKVGDLYQGRTIVTGEGEASRVSGMRTCLGDVLVKVSGDPRLRGNAAVEKLLAEAPAFAESYSYHDRMAGIPVHDEQGTRDRPYELTVTYSATRVDQALRGLGLAPWGSDRPRLAVVLKVHNGDTAYLLAADGFFGLGQRQSLAAASWQFGVPVMVPSEAAFAASGLEAGGEAMPDTHKLEDLARRVGGDGTLAGLLEWDGKALGWAARWRLHAAGQTVDWRIRDVNFDDAFRSAMAGAAQVLSGHGMPR